MSISNVVELKVEQAPASIDELVQEINNELELADAADTEAARFSRRATIIALP